jgi:hypothetical protein
MPINTTAPRRGHSEGEWVWTDKTKTTPTPCQGCDNYYGKVDGGKMLVCAIHPSGVEGDTCPDFKQKENT